jgi:hypothetical protein
VKLDSVAGQSWRNRPLSKISLLIITSLFVGFDIHLSVQQEALIRVVIILAAFDVFQEGLDFHALEGRYYLVGDIPICLKG